MTLKGKRGGKTPSQPEAQPLVIRIQYESKAFISQKTILRIVLITPLGLFRQSLLTHYILLNIYTYLLCF